jgi:transketolase
LRVIPNLAVYRPCDAIETAECWELALRDETRPSVLALTRQKLKPARLSWSADNLCGLGAYEIAPAAGKSQVVIFASGSEVEIALSAKTSLDAAGRPARVVSVPSMERFAQQDSAYQARIMGHETIRIAIEAGVRQGWDRFIGADGHFIGMTDFGASGPAELLYKHFGITPEAAVKAAV